MLSRGYNQSCEVITVEKITEATNLVLKKIRRTTMGGLRWMIRGLGRRYFSDVALTTSSTDARPTGTPCDECPTKLELTKRQSPVPLNRVKVTMTASMSPVGRMTALCLKQDPLVRELRLYCMQPTTGLVADLKPINPSSRAHPYTASGLRHALSKSDIILCVGGAEPDDATTDEEVFLKNTNYIKKVATAVAMFCPEAIVALAVYPINSTVPMFAEIMSQHGVFCPNKILGVMALHTMRARSVVACVLGLEPSSVQVEVVGGGTPSTMIPVISSNVPSAVFENKSDEIAEGIANMSHSVWELNKRQAVISAAHANASFVHKLARGLLGKSAKDTAFFRTSTLIGVPYMSLPVEFGLSGINRNLGMPLLSDKEISDFDGVLPLLLQDIEGGERAGGLVKNNELVETARQVKPVCA